MTAIIERLRTAAKRPSLGWLVVATLVLAGPARAQLVTSGGDSATPADGELRKEITDINAASGSTATLILDVGTITIDPARGNLPALTKQTTIVLNQNCRINAGGQQVFAGPVGSINAAGAFTLTIDRGNPAINSTGHTASGTVTMQNITVTGTGSGNITHVADTDTNVVLNNLIVRGGTAQRGGNGITVSNARSVAASNFEVRGVSGVGVNLTNISNGVTVTGVNYIGLSNTGNSDQTYRVSGDGLFISETGNSDVSINNNATFTDILHVANCDGDGIQVDPDTTTGTDITIRRVRAGRCDGGANGTYNNLTRGIFVSGGSANLVLGNPADDAGIDAVAGGELGITCNDASDAGIQIGVGDDLFNGQVTVQYVRSGPNPAGTGEVWTGVNNNRNQDYGLRAFVNTTSLATAFRVINSQFTCNTVAGCDLNGSSYLVFNDNTVGLAADQQTIPTQTLTNHNGTRLGNGIRGGAVGARPTSASGDGVRINDTGEIRSFARNVIAGNAGNGLVITATGGGAIGWDGVGNQWQRNWFGVSPVGGGTKCIGADDALADSIANFNPTVRGNGTVIWAGLDPSGAVGSGIVYQGGSPLAFVDLTIGDSAVWGLDLDSASNAPVYLLGAKIGVNDAGTGPGDQSIGNGTARRSHLTWENVLGSHGGGVRVNDDWNHLIGDGAFQSPAEHVVPAPIGNTVGTGQFTSRSAVQNRCIISGNLRYGIQVSGAAGNANSRLAISNCYIGVNASGTTAGQSLGNLSRGLGYGNGFTRFDANSMALQYPYNFGAGIRFEPNSNGQTLVGGDDLDERCVVSNNALVGIWLHTAGIVTVINNFIGTDAAGSQSLSIGGFSQAYGILLEQFAGTLEFAPHRALSGAAGADPDMPTQFIGRLPFADLTNENLDGSAGAGNYGNLISGNTLWGVAIEDDGDHTVVSNVLGTDVTGAAAVPNGSSGPGLPMELAALVAPQTFIRTGGLEIGALNQLATGHNTVGDNTSSNLISGNTGHGVAQYRNGICDIAQNYIGLDGSGTGDLGNSLSGVEIWGSGVNQLLVNRIGGNDNDGVTIDGSGDNVLYANYIGTNDTGAAAVPNAWAGVRMTANALGNNVIGRSGTDPASGQPRRNVISGNGYDGIQIVGHGSNVVTGNYIGLNAAGAAALSNGSSATAGQRCGIAIVGRGANVIGGPNWRGVAAAGSEDGNVIGSNAEAGIHISASATVASTGGNNTIEGNFIGLAADGATPVAVDGDGVVIDGTGGAGLAGQLPTGQNLLRGNTIAGNSGRGVVVTAGGQNTLQGNKIGTNAAGAAAVPNAGVGVLVDGCTVPQLIGLANSSNDSTTYDNGNLISGNGGTGLQVTGTVAHLIRGNRIGVNADASAALPNNGDGIRTNMTTAGGTLIIGGQLTGQYNLVSGNTGNGIYLTGETAQTVLNNWVGLNGTGSDAIPNGSSGVLIGENTGANVLTDNRVAGNTRAGIEILGGQNTLKLNRIGTNGGADGLLTNPTQPIGLWIHETAGQNPAPLQTIGVATEGNVISGNAGNGIQIDGTGDCSVISNVIGENITGSAAIPNSGHGIAIGAAAIGAVTIGGVSQNEQNTIGGNGLYGILHAGGQVPVVVANRIGTNANGTAAVPNGAGGVIYQSTLVTAPVTFGGSAGGAGNLVSGNTGPGLVIAGAHPVLVLNNKLGTNLTGVLAIGNAGPGIVISNDLDNVIGDANVGNVISGNVDGGGLIGHGIRINGNGVNSVENNQIGADFSGGQLAGGVGNTGAGIWIERTGTGTGATIRNNTIRDNPGGGVSILTGARERITNNRFLNNGVLTGFGTTTVIRPQLDLGADDLVSAPATANNGLVAPAVLRVVPGSGGQATVTGTVAAGITSVELYRAFDALPTDVDGDLTSVKHHGGADLLLATLTPAGGTFNQTVPLAAGELVTALAFDADGNTSEFSRNVGLVDAAASTLTAVQTVDVDGLGDLDANNADTSTVTATLRDAIGTPCQGVTGTTLSFVYTSGSTGLVPPAGALPATDANGQTSGPVKATQACAVTASATGGGTLVTDTVDISFVATNVDASRSTFLADKTQARSNGIETVTFTFTIRDSLGQPIPGVPAGNLQVTATPSTGVTIVQPSQATDASGQATATATGIIEQSVVFRGLVGAEVPSAQTVSFVAVPLDATSSTLTVSNSPVAAEPIVTPPDPNASAAATLQLTIINADGNPVAGVQPNEVTWTSDAVNPASLVVTNQTTPSDASGRFSATVRSNTIQQVVLTATVRGVAVQQTGTVVFTAGAAAAGTSTFQVAPSGAVADDIQTITVSITVRDGLNQPVANEITNIAVTPSDGVTITQPAATDVNGQATGSFRAQIAGTYDVSVIVGPLPGAFTLGPQQVLFTSNPPDGAASSVTAAPAAIVADGQDASTVTIRLVDTAGRPLAGVQPGEIQVAAVPDGGLTITQPTTATDAQGQTTATLRGTVPATVTVQVTARGVAIAPTAQPQVTLRDYQDLHYAIGTHFIGLPVEPLDPSPAAVFANLLPNLRLARWNAGAEDYVYYGPGSTQPQVRAGVGLWLQIGSPLDLRTVGVRTPDGPFDVALDRGWNQVGNPYTGPLAFRLDQIDVFQNGSLLGNLSTAAARAAVDPYGWIWDPVLGYLLVVDQAAAGGSVPGSVAMGQGFWMRALQDNVTIRFHGPTRAAAASRAKAATPRQWLMSLQVSANGETAQSNLLGVSDTRLAALVPPDGPVMPHVGLAFKDDLGRAVAADLRTGPLTRATRWTALVNAPAGSDVTVAWPGVGRALPAGHRMWLIDPTTGRRTLMNSRAAYTYQNGAGSRELIVEVDPRGQASLAVTTLSVQASKGRSRSVPIEYNLSAPARVNVVIRGLRGTVVRQLTADGAAGINTLAWDRLDSQGRRLPAGVYQVELTASTDEGEIARVTRTVTLN